MLCMLLNLLKPTSSRETVKGSAMASEVVSIPKVDFSQLEMESGTTAVWGALQGQVMHALQSYGCFEAEYDKVTPELRDVLFGRALPELFGLPLDTKLLNKSDILLSGYSGQIPGWAYENLQIQDDVDKFTRMLWPQGNPTFSDTVSAYNKHMKVLEQSIVRMIFHDLGIEKYYDSYIESTKYETQMNEYGIPLDQGSQNGMNAHIDPNLVSILCRNQAQGLEIQTKDGEWIPVVHSPNSFTVIIGAAIQAWTNGRLRAPLHRVRDAANKKRYTIIYGSVPIEGYIIETPKELIDEEHPLFCKPYLYQEEIISAYSEKGDIVGSTLMI